MTPDKSASDAREPTLFCPWHPDHGWRVDLAEVDEQSTIAACMRDIESATQQGWRVRPLYASSPAHQGALLDGRSPAVSTRPRDFLAWAVDMFGPVAKLRGERLMRFVEEALELAHADEMGRATLDAIANRVYSRAPGQITKEIGQAQACLEAYCENIGESASDLAEIELQRVRQIPRDEWQRRHTAKQAIGIALTDKRPPMQEEGK